MTALRLGGYNQQVVLELIRANPGMNRVDIAERTGLTAQAISKIVRKLLQDGLVREAEAVVPSAKGGRPAIGLRIIRKAAYAFGVHIDRDQTVYALLDLAGGVVAREHRATPQTGPAASVRQIDSVVAKLLTRNAVPGDKVLGIGVGTPGPLEPDTGVVHSPGGMTGWKDVPLAKLISDRTGLPATIENDTIAAAIGESWIGKARGAQSVLFVYLGFGMGAALLIDGQVHRGAGLGGEFHHVPVQPSGPICVCGSRGCVGQYVPPAAVVEAVRERRGDKTAKRDYAEICRAAVEGASIERDVLTNAARLLSLALIGIANVLDPAIVVLGGVALDAAKLIHEPELRTAFARRQAYRRGHETPVELSDAGADVGAVGAASLVLHTTYAPRISRATGSASTNRP